MGGNLIFGTISSDLSESTRLEYVYLGSNHISGTLSSYLGKLAALKAFDMGDNSLVGSSAAEFSSWKLKLLSIYSNPGLDWDLAQLFRWPNLHTALMQECSIAGALPAFLPQSLSVLLLYRNLISGSIPHTIFEIDSKLGVLDLSANAISDSLPTSTCNCTKAKSILMINAHISGTPPEYSASIRSASHVVCFTRSPKKPSTIHSSIRRFTPNLRR